jgi:hypothetical protein
MKRSQIQQRLAQEHPDFGEIAKDQDFANFGQKVQLTGE